MDPARIRNFCIVAHIDHGKSTLADRLLERTATFTSREMKNQILDSMDIERERGITIKAHAISMTYTDPAGDSFLYNLIDTPGHVDFSYEVSRSLAACEGALLLVDAAQGIEAQTVSNLLMALDAGLEIIPVVNKIDLEAARPEQVASEIAELIGCEPETVIHASARDGVGVERVLEAIRTVVPPPPGDRAKPLRALIFDSEYDQFRGVIAYVRVVDGALGAGDEIRLQATGRRYEVIEVGRLRLGRVVQPHLAAGEVGYVIGGIKDVHEVRVGDTVVHARDGAVEPLPGYRRLKSMVWSGLYPVETGEFLALRDALDRLILNDASLEFEPEGSAALGSGFRCGFLGPLHNEIVLERLRREYDLELIATVPNVGYRVVREDGQVIEVRNPSQMPVAERRDVVEEPYVEAKVVLPPEAIGPVTKLCQDCRGIHKGMEYLESSRVVLTYDIPLSEIITDFYDRLKSVSRGYASLDYEFIGYRTADLVRLDVRLNGDAIDAFCSIVHRSRTYEWGREMTERLKRLIPKQLFPISVQATIGSKVVARSTISALRKNVTAKCYGGDVTRKRKLLERQKEGKKRMKMLGKVRVPQDAFLAILKRDE